MTAETANRDPLANVARDAQALCKRAWWAFLIGGIASVAFGVMAFINPAVALFVLAVFFAASVLVDGAANAWGALQNREKDGWWLMLLIGIAGVLIGGYALLNPPVSIGAFVLLVAFMAVFLGVMMISLGYKVRRATDKEWLLYVGGAVSVIFGVMIFTRPAAGSLSVVWLIATWAIVVGALRILIAFRVKNLSGAVKDRLAGVR